HATTMERVAEAAGISKATLYSYFTDKDDLFIALVSERRLAPNPEHMAQYKATIERTLLALATHADKERITSVILELLTKAAERRNDAVYRLFVEVAFEQPALVERMRAAHDDGETFKRLWDLTAELSNLLPPELDAEVLMHILFALVTGYTVVE